MFSRTNYLVACVALLFAGAAATLAQVAPPGSESQPVDPRVEQAVRLLGYDHEVLKNGSVAIVIPTGNGKARMVIVQSKTQQEGLTEVRLVSSISRIYDGEIPQPVAEMIRDVNKELKAGQFVILEQDGKKIVVFVLVVKADISANDLGDVIKATCKVAAKMSETLGRVS